LWIRQGSVREAVRASAALPGIFTPVQLDGQWLVDGGLVNPVPVSLCRAMGADVVIAVNVNIDALGKHFRETGARGEQWDKDGVEATLLDKVSAELKVRASAYLPQLFEPGHQAPGLFDVMAGSINIMQDRITRSRMAGDPPDVMLGPRLAHIGLLEFERASEAIEAGRASVRRAQPLIQDVLSLGSNPA
jgi:NTE family protein